MTSEPVHVSQSNDFVAGPKIWELLASAQFLGGLQCPLGQFLKSSLAQSFCSGHAQSGSDVWPMPLPSCQAHHQSLARLKGRRRARAKFHLAVQSALRAFIGASNWLVLGRPRTIPDAAVAQLTGPPSATQRRAQERLRRFITYHVRHGTGPWSGLERASQKFSIIGDALDNIASCAAEIYYDLDNYSRVHSKPKSKQTGPDSSNLGPSRTSDRTPHLIKTDMSQLQQSVLQGTLGDSSCSHIVPSGPPVCVNTANVCAMDVVADRLKFNHAPSFQPIRY